MTNVLYTYGYNYLMEMVMMIVMMVDVGDDYYYVCYHD